MHCSGRTSSSLPDNSLCIFALEMAYVSLSATLSELRTKPISDNFYLGIHMARQLCPTDIFDVPEPFNMTSNKFFLYVNSWIGTERGEISTSSDSNVTTTLSKPLKAMNFQNITEQVKHFALYDLKEIGTVFQDEFLRKHICPDCDVKMSFL